MRDFAKLVSPLYRLLRKEVPWRWSKLEQDALGNIKTALCSDSVLRHYDPLAELILQCDASSVGVAAALLQRRPDGALITTCCLCIQDTEQCRTKLLPN